MVAFVVVGWVELRNKENLDVAIEGADFRQLGLLRKSLPRSLKHSQGRGLLRQVILLRVLQSFCLLSIIGKYKVQLRHLSKLILLCLSNDIRTNSEPHFPLHVLAIVLHLMPILQNCPFPSFGLVCGRLFVIESFLPFLQP